VNFLFYTGCAGDWGRGEYLITNRKQCPRVLVSCISFVFPSEAQPQDVGCYTGLESG
jgi:hypothetical protein